MGTIRSAPCRVNRPGVSGGEPLGVATPYYIMCDILGHSGTFSAARGLPMRPSRR